MECLLSTSRLKTGKKEKVENYLLRYLLSVAFQLNLVNLLCAPRGHPWRSQTTITGWTRPCGLKSAHIVLETSMTHLSALFCLICFHIRKTHKDRHKNCTSHQPAPLLILIFLVCSLIMWFCIQQEVNTLLSIVSCSLRLEKYLFL